MRVVFDLDGTLADIEHRVHFIQQDKKDWKSFFAACGGDKPITPMINLLDSLQSDHWVEIWTGRSVETFDETVRWLEHNLHGYWSNRIKMRGVGDHRPDTVLKKEWLDSCTVKPNLVFEDRESVVAMWRENGIVCCQCAEGKF